uniref:Protein kinase domain-containing protein n=1 Tax=Neolamprologus brichardi TaxID=32507 RepID=A0A3Q4G9Q2_NEOBR
HKLDPKTQQNRSLEHHYEVEGFLGEGRFGIVTKCRNTKTNKVVAIKVNKRNHKILQKRQKHKEGLEKGINSRYHCKN